MRTLPLYRLATAFLLLALAIIPAGCKDDDPVASGTPTVNEELVTTWRAVSATVDGESVDMADFFDLPENAAFFHMIISADATYRSEVLDAGDQVIQYESGTAVSSGMTLVITMTSADGVAVVPPEVVAVGIYDVTGVTLTYTLTEGTSVIVLVFNNWLS